MIDKLRHSATRSVLSRRDVIVVASVSCIYGLGAPEDYLGMRIDLEKEMEIGRDGLLRDLVAMQYERNDTIFIAVSFASGATGSSSFRPMKRIGPCASIFSATRSRRSPKSMRCAAWSSNVCRGRPIFPASHYVTSKVTRKRAIETIIAELKERIAFFRVENRLHRGPTNRGTHQL